MSTAMRAKMIIQSVEKFASTEVLNFRAVYKNDGPYAPDGLDENNTFAKFTPSASMNMVITNEALHGMFAPGDVFYVDFTPVPTTPPAVA